MEFKHIITGLSWCTHYHDDMFDEEVKIIDFPYIRLFGDFRIFNGISVSKMDDLIGEIRTAMIKIANYHAFIERIEKLKEQTKEAK
jgi:hypothetical protein